MKSIATRFLLPVVVLAAMFLALDLYREYSARWEDAAKLVDRQAALGLAFDLAIRSYVAEEIRPAMEQRVGEDEFFPETMSTSFVARSIFDKVRQEFPDYTIKFSSDDPRNPANKAGPDELRMIQYFNTHPEVQKWSGEIDLNGQPHIVHFNARRMKESCLRCHGNPEDAPASLIERYGATAGFHRPVGEVVALDTVAIPMDKVQATCMADMRERAIFMVVGLTVLVILIALVFRFVVARRLVMMRAHCERIAGQPDSAAMHPVEVCGNDEISELARSFNIMVETVRDAHGSLERRVADQTASLHRAKEGLQHEVDDRKHAQDLAAIRTRDLEKNRRVAMGMMEDAEQARKETGAALAHTRAILTSASDAIITIDGGGVVREFNPAAERIFGYELPEIYGRNVTTLMPPTIVESHEQGLSAYVRTGERRILGQTVEVEGLRKDGTAFPLELTVDEIGGTERQLFTAICRDITERKHADEERLRLAETEHERNQLKEAIAAQDQLLGVVGHELRTPLAALRASTEFLVTDGARETEGFDTFLRSINDEVVRMSGLVNDLLEAARLNSGRARWNWGSVRMATACEKAVDEIRPLVDSDRVQLVCTVEPQELTMSGDSEAVRRLVLNLVDNSRKHTSRGSIRVSARTVELEEKPGVEIKVVDTGEGIAPEIADRLGTAFALNSGMVGSKHAEGTGLGISICRGIVAAHGGTVSIRSALGKGTTVTVRLRADLPEAIRDAHDAKVEQEIAA